MAKNRRSLPFHIFPAVFWPFRLFFHPFFMILAKNGKKTGAQKWRNGKGKNVFLSHFFPVPIFSRSLPGTSLVWKWINILQGYNLAIRHVPGKRKPVDTLSRQDKKDALGRKIVVHNANANLMNELRVPSNTDDSAIRKP